MSYRRTTPAALNLRHYPFRFLGEEEPTEQGSFRVPTSDLLDYMKTMSIAFGAGFIIGAGLGKFVKAYLT